MSKSKSLSEQQVSPCKVQLSENCRDTGSQQAHRILAVLPYNPNCIRSRTLKALEELTKRAVVDLVCLDDGLPLEVPHGIRKRNIIPNRSNLARAKRIFFGLLCGRPIAHEFYNSSLLIPLLAEMDLSVYDAVYVERLPLHRLPLRHPRLIYDCVDCFSHQSRALARHVGGLRRLLYAIDAVLLPHEERAACNAACVVLVTAPREAAQLRPLGVTKDIEIWRHSRWVDLPLRTSYSSQRFVVSFHGKLSYAANLLALRTLNDSIAPSLDPSRFELRILGKCPPRIQRKFPALQFIGYVDSIADSIRESDLSVFPMSVSVGFSNKAMESLAAGVPFIATREVVEGLPPMPQLMERGVYVRAMGDFSREIERFSRLSPEERREISHRCYAFAREVDRLSDRENQWCRILGWESCVEQREADSSENCRQQTFQGARQAELDKKSRDSSLEQMACGREF